MRSFMAGHLQDDKRKAKFEHDLQRDQAAEGVVVALFSGGQKSGD